MNINKFQYMPTTGGGSGSGTTLISAVITQAAHGFVVNNLIYQTTTTGIYAKAQANNSATAEVVGVVTTVVDANNFQFSSSGSISGLTGLTAGQIYFLSDITAGLMTLTEPTSVSSVSKPIGVATSATTLELRNYRTSPSQGQTVDYLYAKGVSNQTGISNTITPLNFTNTVSGNIPLASNAFTLTVGKIYRITANLALNGSSVSGDVFNSYIVDNTNTAVSGLVTPILTLSDAIANRGSQPVIDAIFTPTVTGVYKIALQRTSGTGTVNIDMNASSLSVIQLGSSAIVQTPTLISIQTLTSGTTYTPTAGTTKIECYVIGGGGAGGGCASNANTTSAAGGSAGGVVGFSETVNSFTSYTYSVGAGGTGVSGAAGGNGVLSTITVNGNVYTGGAGVGGNVANTNTAPNATLSSAGGTTVPASVSGNAFYVSNGGSSGVGMSLGTNVHVSGFGGSNMFGTGGRGLAGVGGGSSNGSAADGFGGGGSGGRQNNTTAVSGGSGTSGSIIIKEFKSA